MDNYFEEVRDEYFVSIKMKKIWKIEMDILKEIIRICRAHSLKYFVYGGTLLGAVRHKGFIPWDDDMDVAMLREDYELFLDYASKELDTEQYTLQKSEQFGVIYEGFSRIRHNHSTAIIERDRGRDCNHGIFVDIFPLDNIPNDDRKRKKQCNKLKLLESMVYYHNYASESTRYPKIGKLIKEFGGENFWRSIIKKTKNESIKYNDISCERVGILSCDPYDEKCYWYIEDINRTKKAVFEDMIVDIPVGYDRCLTIGYGAYMEFPPVEERGKWHSNIFFDPDNAYETYMK